MAERHHSRTFACQHCQAVVTKTSRKSGPQHKYCSQQCNQAAYGLRKNPPQRRACSNCGKDFVTQSKIKKHCSAACTQKAADQRKVERGIKGFTGKRRRTPRPIIDGKRVCLDCDRNLPIEDFPVAKSAKSGRRGVCKTCYRLYMRVKRQTEKSISQCVDREMRAALTRRGGSEKVRKLCGYTVAELREHLEKQFTRGMSWERFEEIHIDHIIPRAEFNLGDEDEWRACWALTNLQPRWAKDNLKKGARRTSLL